MSTQSSSTTTRSPHLDNAKAILISLVVLGHILEIGLISGLIFGAVYRTLYTFHMPAFVLIAGYFSKDEVSFRWFQELSGLLALLIIFQALYLAFSTQILGSGLTFWDAITRPYWILWYLVSLVFWKATLPLIKAWKVSLPLSLLVAITGGYFAPDSGWLGISRTLYFWPFFIAGYALQGRPLSYAYLPARFVAGALMTAAFCLYCTTLSAVDFKWLWARSFRDLGFPEFAIETRVLLLLLSICLTVAFFQLVPRRKHFWTGLGRVTLPIFLLHGFLVRGADPMGFGSALRHPMLALIAMVLIIAVTGNPVASSAANRAMRLGHVIADKVRGWRFRPAR